VRLTKAILFLFCVALILSGQFGIGNAASTVQPFSGNVIIADEGNNRLVMVNNQGKVLWVLPQKGDLSSGQPQGIKSPIIGVAAAKQ
jgi:hypothetical protein